MSYHPPSTDISDTKDQASVGLFSSQKDMEYSANGTIPSWTRPAYNEEKFDQSYERHGRPVKTIKDRLRTCKSGCECSAKCVKKFIFNHLPFLKLIANYNVKRDLVSDIIAGLTVGIMHIPQGMAYGMLATLPAVYGLYVSFFPVIVYFFFGTSRHISIGTFAVMSLMISSAVERANCPALVASLRGTNTTASAVGTLNSTGLDSNVTTQTKTIGYDDEMLCRIGVATAVTFMTGIIQLCMGFLKLGFVTIYLSYPLTRGLTTGAAMHVFTSQVKYAFGLPARSFQGPLKLVYTYIEYFRVITKTNVASLVMACICILILALTKEFVNPKVKKAIKMPIPMELLLVIFGTITSYFWKMEEKFDISVVGVIPTGIPAPTFPPLQYFASAITDAFSIALVAFAISVSMVKLFAKKHNYRIDPNQELIAYGMCNTAGSVFNCYVAASSLSRSLVQEGVGGRTQIVGLISSILILVVLFAIGPLFEQLPRCVLAAIVIVNLKGMFLQFRDLKELWSVSIYDFLNWLIVFLAVVFLNVDSGLGVGLAFSLLAVIFRTQRPFTAILGRLPNTDIYKNVEIYPAVEEIPGIKIFRYESSLYFANVEHFVEKLYSKTGVNPRKILLERAKKDKKDAAEKKSLEKDALRQRKAQQPDKEAVGVQVEPDTSQITDIIVDCTTMGYVDFMGVNTLKQVIDEYKEVGVRLNLAGCKVAVRETLEAAGFYEKIPKTQLFLSVHDAVRDAEERRASGKEENGIAMIPFNTRL